MAIDFSNINLDTYYQQVAHPLFVAKVKSVLVEMGKVVAAEIPPVNPTPAQLQDLAKRKACMAHFTDGVDHWLRVLLPKLAVMPAVAPLMSQIMSSDETLTSQDRNTIGNALLDGLWVLLEYYKNSVTIPQG